MARKPPARPSMDIGRRQAAPAIVPGDNRLAGAREVPLDQVVPDPHQPRQDWDHDDGEQRLDELATSIREFGVLQPLLVREEGSLDDGRTRYVVIAGGRRRAAAERAELPTLPVVVRGGEPGRIRVMQLIENLQRQDLPPLDEARGYQELMDAEKLTSEAVARRVHVSGQRVRERLRLLADQVFADAVERRQISATAARDIMRLPDEGIARFRQRVLDGEKLQSNDIARASAELAAAGVVNSRRKGGGRPSRTTHETPPTPQTIAPPLARDQASLDPIVGVDDTRATPSSGDQAPLDPRNDDTPGETTESRSDQASLDPVVTREASPARQAELTAVTVEKDLTPDDTTAAARAMKGDATLTAAHAIETAESARGSAPAPHRPTVSLGGETSASDAGSSVMPTTSRALVPRADTGAVVAYDDPPPLIDPALRAALGALDHNTRVFLLQEALQMAAEQDALGAAPAQKMDLAELGAWIQVLDREDLRRLLQRSVATALTCQDLLHLVEEYWDDPTLFRPWTEKGVRRGNFKLP